MWGVSLVKVSGVVGRAGSGGDGAPVASARQESATRKLKESRHSTRKTAREFTSDSCHHQGPPRDMPVRAHSIQKREVTHLIFFFFNF